MASGRSARSCACCPRCCLLPVALAAADGRWLGQRRWSMCGHSDQLGGQTCEVIAESIVESIAQRWHEGLLLCHSWLQPWSCAARRSVRGGARERFITEVALLEECRGQVATACARRRAQLFCVHHQCRCYNCTRAKRGEDRGRPYACEGEWGSPYRSMKRKRRFFRPSPGASTHRLSAPCGRSLALTRPLTGLRL